MKACGWFASASLCLTAASVSAQSLTFTPVGSTLDFGNAGKNGDGTVASGNAGTMLTQ